MIAEALLVRADADVATGTGHVMRCLALAQAWQDAGGRAVFMMAQPLPPMCERLLSEKMDVVPIAVRPGSPDDAARVAELAHHHGAARVVVDGYHFDGDYQRELKAAGLRLLFVDDNGHASHYSADLVLNQNVHADERLYHDREPFTRLLLGPRYALLRREFQLWKDWKRTIQPLGRKVLVSMGGSDAGNVTATAISMLKGIRVEDLEVVVVVGGGNPHLQLLEQAADSFRGNLRLAKNVVNMPELLAWADVIVAAAGSICWEICAMALPALLVVTASNQKHVARRLAELGAARTLDSETESFSTASAPLLQNLLESKVLRQSLSSQARELVDMDGSARVVSALRGLSDE